MKVPCFIWNLQTSKEKIGQFHTYTLFYKHFYKQHLAEIGKKQVTAKQHQEAELLLLGKKFFFFIHVIIRNLTGNNFNKLANECVCFNEITRFIIMKMRLKMKNRSHRCDIKWPRPRHGCKYTKYKICLSSYMYWTTPKQHLKLNSWNCYTRWVWVEKKVLLI